MSPLSLLLLVLLPGALAGSFDPNRMRLIKRVTPSSNASASNFLFRGSLPVTSNHTFAKAELTAQAAVLAKAANLTLPSTFYIVILSLLDPFEIADAVVEENYFKAHPTEGQYDNWLTVGDLVPPQSLSASKREALAKNLSQWQVDKLPAKMAQIDKLLDQGYPTGTALFYMHCEAGMDRTGEMSGSYYLHALNYTFAQALSVDNSIETRNISIYSQNAFQWYCYFLQYTTEPWRDCSLP